MSNIDKQALREAAEKATPGSWEYYPGNTSIEYNVDSMDEDQGSIVYVDSGDFTQKQTDLNGTFIAAANPATVLALLDELEAVQQGFIANQEEANEAIKYATELKEQLARACAGREEAFREVDDMQKSLDHTHRRRAIWRGRAEEAEAKLEAAGNRIAELEAREIKPAKGEVLVVVSGFTGCGKSAIAGEIEIAMKAIGVPVQWTNGDAEKRMTGTDWLTAIEMYKPTVRIVEVNVPRAAGIGVKGE